MAGERLDRLDGVGDGRALILHLVHRLLHEAVAHEIPARLARGFADLRIELAHRAVDRERRLQLAASKRLDETPEADADAVFMPGPVRHVRQQRLSHRRRQHGAGHGRRRTPVLDIDDGPDRDPRVVGQAKLRPAMDRRVVKPAANAAADRIGHGLSPVGSRASGASYTSPSCPASALEGVSGLCRSRRITAPWVTVPATRQCMHTSPEAAQLSRRGVPDVQPTSGVRCSAQTADSLSSLRTQGPITAGEICGHQRAGRLSLVQQTHITAVMGPCVRRDDSGDCLSRCVHTLGHRARGTPHRGRR